MMPPDSPEDGAVTTWVAAMEAAMYPVCRDVSDAMWILLTTGDGAPLDATDERRAAVYGDPAPALAISRWRADGWAAADPQLDRRVTLLHRELMREAISADPAISAMAASLTTLHGETRASLNGAPVTDATLTDTLRTNPDPAARRAAWEARTAAGAVFEPALRALAAQRNAAAVGYGFADYTGLGMFAAGLEDLPELDLPPERSGAPWDITFTRDHATRTLLKRHFTADRLGEIALDTLAQLGLPLDGITLDLVPRAGKSEHAWCVPVDPPLDIRVLANAADGVEAWQTVFHELGHAAHARYVQGATFLLRDSPNAAMNEAVAQSTAWIVYDRPWLEGALGLTAGEADAVVTYGDEKRRQAVRWQLLWSRLEPELYAGADVTARYWELAEQLLGVTADARTRQVPAWAKLIHFVTNPMYLQNYLIADLAANQLRGAAGDDLGGFLKERVIEVGAALGWQELMVHATGMPLCPQGYRRDWLA